MMVQHKKRLREFFSSLTVAFVGIAASIIFSIIGICLTFNDELKGGLWCIVLALICLVPFIFMLYDSGREDKKAKKLKEQKNLEETQKKLAFTSGLEKYHAMDILDAAEATKKAKEEHERALAAMRELNMMTFRSTYQEKEKDWALMGGIADGLAGPGAGIATAMDAMRENEQIRARNAVRRQAAAQQFFQMSEMERKAAANEPSAVSAASMEVLRAKYVVNFSWTPDELFSMLFPFVETTVNKDTLTGAVTVTAKWKQTTSGPRIDGAIRAKLYTAKGKCAGCAYLVLPKEGTLEKEGVITGICATPSQPGNYKVEFEPVDLWELATKKEFKPRVEGGISETEHREMAKKLEADFQAELAKAKS